MLQYALRAFLNIYTGGAKTYPQPLDWAITGGLTLPPKIAENEV